MTVEPHELVIVRVPIERPDFRRVNQYRQGQHDRRHEKPCASTNGDYLNGWYDPYEDVPPFCTAVQVRAFNLTR